MIALGTDEWMHRLHKTTKPRRTVAVLAAGLLAFVAVCLLWSLVEARLVFVDRVVVSDPDVPAELNGMRIAYASDVHAGTLLGQGQVRRTLAKVRSLDADAIVLGGDYVGGDWAGGAARGEEMFYPEAAKLEAPLGVFAVLGNHEGRDGAPEARALLEDAGIVLLANDRVRLRRSGAGIRLAGVEDLITGSPDFAAAARDIPKNEFAIVVSHNPDALPNGLRETRGAFDLGLSAHTHGGQITAFGLWAPVIPSRYGQSFRGGWERIEGVPVLVSRGAGVFILPMRFFAPAQIHLIELRQGEPGVRSLPPDGGGSGGQAGGR